MPDKPPYADEIEVEIDYVGNSLPMRSMVFGHISGNGTVVLECGTKLFVSHGQVTESKSG